MISLVRGEEFLPGAKKRQVAVLGQAAALPSSIEFPMSLLRVSLQLAGYETVVVVVAAIVCASRSMNSDSRGEETTHGEFLPMNGRVIQ